MPHHADIRTFVEQDPIYIRVFIYWIAPALAGYGAGSFINTWFGV